MQYLTVPVDVPQVQILHTVRLKQSYGASAIMDQDIVPIGKGVPMELTINYTRSWDFARIHSPGSDTMDFCYELQTTPDWLIGGQRVGHYTAREAEDISFFIILWPQRTGHLLLPPIEIHSVARSGDQSREYEAAGLTELSTETDYKDQSHTIFVVSDLSRTTVNLDLSSGGGSWLVDSESRNT